MSLQGEVGNIIAAEAARAAELLLRLTPAPNGLSAIASFRQAFVDRYGRDREVPLLELLDPDRGLGPLQNYEHAKIATDPAKTAQRSQALLELACTALHGRQRFWRSKSATSDDWKLGLPVSTLRLYRWT